VVLKDGHAVVHVTATLSARKPASKNKLAAPMYAYTQMILKDGHAVVHVTATLFTRKPASKKE
jgi:hypothetical protein